MQIHDLNTKSLTDPAYVAFDDGTDTYKTEFNDVVADAAAAAVADADLTDNTVAFTSGDAASPTAWTAVDVLTSGLTIKVLFNRISTMIKNVRWLYSKLGTTDISSIGGGTVTGAISSLNSKIAGVETASNTVSGLTIRLYYQQSCPNIMCLKITGTTSSQLSTASRYANLWNANTFITNACGMRSATLIKYILIGSYKVQLQIETSGLIKIGYATNISDGVSADIPSGVNVYVEEMVFLK